MTLNDGGRVKDPEEPLADTYTKVECGSEACPDSLWLRFKMMLAIAIPTMMTDFVQRTQDLINLSFLGHLGDNALIAGVGLGSVFVNFSGWALVIGMNSALDTLVSQSAGAGKLELCGVYLNRGRFIMTLFFLPVLILSFYVEPILVGMGQNPQVAAYTKEYMRAYLPGLYIMGLQNCQKKFLNNLKKVKVPMVSQCVASFLHVFWIYFLVSENQMNLGVTGTAIGMVITNSTVFLSNLVYTAYLPDIQEAVFWPDRRTFQDLGEYVRIGVASAMMLALDLLAGSAIRFCTGYLSVDIQSAQGIMVNLMVLLYMLGSGLDAAACALIGHALGAGQIESSKQFYATFRQIAAGLILVVIFLTYFFQNALINVYTNIESVRIECMAAFPFLLMNIFPDLFKGMLKGIIKAMGI